MFNLQTSITLTPAQAETVLAAWQQRSVRCTQIQALKGGMINSVLQLSFDQPPFEAVIKLNQPGVSGPYALGKEANILRYLRTHSQFPCPQVYLEDSSGQDFPYAFLLLECLPGGNLWQSPTQPADLEALDRQLAEILLELHSHTRPTFGKVDEPGSACWADLFVPRLHEVRAQPEITQRLSPAVLANVDYVIAKAASVLADQGVPTLIHADIWAGNIIVQNNGSVWQIAGLVDPGSEYADVEMELAYLESFNNPRPAFMEVYTRQRPLRPGYETRRKVYWLLTYLIHVWLFGDQHYLDITAELAAELRQTI